MAGVVFGASVVVLTPPLWWGVMEAIHVGDAYSRARLIHEQTGEWPEVAAYDRKNGAHRGLTVEQQQNRDRDTSRALAEQARDDAAELPIRSHARAWLERFASRLQAEADFDMNKGVSLWR